MIVITGANGFIGSELAEVFIKNGKEVVIVDDFTHNNFDLSAKRVDRDDFFQWFKNNKPLVEIIYHFGAISDTLSNDEILIKYLNVYYTQNIWHLATEYKVPLVYASSAATYGDGGFGYSDNHNDLHKLQPLNFYGWSKHNIDKWVLSQKKTPLYWAGLKFFNVYGKNEEHKGRMASMVYQMHKNKLKNTPSNIFKYGEHKRDFIYVKDIINLSKWILDNGIKSGIYNVGTGIARSFNDIATILNSQINYVVMPDNIKKHYQNFTQADITKLRNAGYNESFFTLEEGIKDCYHG